MTEDTIITGGGREEGTWTDTAIELSTLSK